MRWLFSVRYQLVIAIALCVVITAAFWWFLTNHQHDWIRWVACWLGAANLTAFAFYSLDKYLARKVIILRIPETVLHTLAGIGGSPAALLAMLIFRHKTIKPSFRVLFWSIVVVQLALTAYIVKVLWWN